MPARDEIIAWADELLDAGSFDDYCHNGLQVPGAREVETVVSGVSANLALLEAAAERHADLVLVHHGLFWGSGVLELTERVTRRLRTILEADMSLGAYHLPLDAHPEIGNNALLREALGLATDAREFGLAKGRPIGAIGLAPGDGLSADELALRIESALGSSALHLGEGPERIRSVGLVTGGGARNLGEAIELGLDALISGEPSEPAMAEAHEGGIHFFAAGHHATERAGVRRLGELVAERFGLSHEFVDVPNPV